MHRRYDNRWCAASVTAFTKFNNLPFTVTIRLADNPPETLSGDYDARQLNTLLVQGQLQFEGAAHMWNLVAYKKLPIEELRQRIWRMQF